MLVCRVHAKNRIGFQASPHPNKFAITLPAKRLQSDFLIWGEISIDVVWVLFETLLFYAAFFCCRRCCWRFFCLHLLRIADLRCVGFLVLLAVRIDIDALLTLDSAHESAVREFMGRSECLRLLLWLWRGGGSRRLPAGAVPGVADLAAFQHALVGVVAVPAAGPAFQLIDVRQ